MRRHEKEHSAIFAQLLAENGFRQCYFGNVWFWGGLFYGVAVGILGLKAIGTSTAVIEDIVDQEFERSLERLTSKQEIHRIIRAIQLEERGRRHNGQELANGRAHASSFVVRVARTEAYAAKYLAERL